MQTYNQLNDKVVLITGASSGLGKQLAYQFARQGAVVVGCARNLSELKRVAYTCRQMHDKPAYALYLDVADPQQIEHVVKYIETQIGAIDILVNNAGFGLLEKAIDFEMQVAEKMFRVNVLGLMYLSKYVALNMAQRHRGEIINIASVAGKIATPKAAIYSATKAAVIKYSDALRLELKPLGIKVLTVNLGPIRTNFFKKADKQGNYVNHVKNIILNPELVAEKIINATGKHKRELNLPFVFEFAYLGYTLFPRLGDFLATTVFNKK